MTTEEKARAYDEALKVIKECNPDENGFITIYPQEIFSELAESEDERIRKWLEETIESMSDNNIIFKDVRRIDVLHWLEKQGEKPQVDGFDAELNALLKKYEHLSKKELQEPLEFYLGVVRDDLDIVREEKPKWSEEEIKEAQLCVAMTLKTAISNIPI